MLKRLSMMLIVLSVSLVLFACNKKEEPAVNGQETAGEAAETDGNSETRLFETAKGEVEIPVDPQAIVTDYYLGEFLAVGVKPIISSEYSLSNPFLADYVDGIETLNTTSSETALEMITAAEPDLIVTLSEEDYDTFSKIAPTVYIPYGEYSDEELFLYIADMLGKTEEAESYVAEFRSKAEEAKEEIREIVGDQTVSIVEVWPNEIYTMGSHFARGASILFDLWELKAPDVVQEEMVDGDTLYQVVSLEVLPEYTGDFILYGILADADSSFLEDSAIWQGLEAVQEGRVMSYEQVAFMHSDPITLSNQLDIYIEYFNQFK